MITKATSVINTEQGMALSGELVFSTVSTLLEQGTQYIQQQTKSNSDTVFQIDCQEMQRIDSAGIALLIEWQRQCLEAKRSCVFVGQSEQAQSLIQAYRLQSLIAA